MNTRRWVLTLGATAALAACGGGSDDSSEGGIASLEPAAAESASTGSADAFTETETDTGGSDSGQGAEDDQPANDEPPSDEDVDKAFEEYEQCADDLGLGGLFAEADGGSGVDVDVIDDAETGDLGDGALDPDAFERLDEECGALLEDAFGSFDLSPEEEAEQRDLALAFSRCMRDAGIDFPDPSADGSGVIEFDADADMEAVNAAMNECNSVYDVIDGETSESGQ